ncbi:MAG TPA: dihydrodipicolinate synthase family protein [Cellulomonas sp.]
MTAREPLRGVIPPIITPLTPAGDVDVVSLERLVNFEVDAGVHAIFVLGTGGEGPYLTEDQQRITLETVTTTVARRIPVLAGVSDIGTRRVLHNAAIAQDYPIDALVSTSAFYGSVGRNEIDHHFRTIAASSDLPLYAYDIPVFTGVKIPAELTVQLAKDGVIAGVKDTSGEEDGFRYIIEHTRDIEGFSVITGSDITGDAAIFQGAHGRIVGVANIDPHGFVEVYDAAVKGDWETARRVQERLHALRLITKIAGGRIGGFSATLGSFKAAQVLRGIIDHDGLQPPLLPLDDAERAQVKAVLDAQGLGRIDA